MYQVKITTDNGVSEYYSDSIPDYEAIKECLFYLWCLKLDRIDIFEHKQFTDDSRESNF